MKHIFIKKRLCQSNCSFWCEKVTDLINTEADDGLSFSHCLMSELGKLGLKESAVFGE